MSDSNSPAPQTPKRSAHTKSFVKKARAINKRKNKSALDLITGFDRGLEPYHILGANKVDNNLVFYIVWKNPETGEPMSNYEMVYATEVYQKAPQLAISFFEKNLVIPP